MKGKLDDSRSKSLHRAFIRTSKMHRKVCQHRFQELGLTEGQPKVLDYLHHHNGGGSRCGARLHLNGAQRPPKRQRGRR